VLTTIIILIYICVGGLVFSWAKMIAHNADRSLMSEEQIEACDKAVNDGVDIKGMIIIMILWPIVLVLCFM